MRCFPLILILAVWFSGCASRDPSQLKEFIDDPLSGQINGKEWAYKHAYIDPTVDTPEEEDFVFIFLPYAPKKPCPKEEDVAQGSIMVSAPKNTKLTKFKKGGRRTVVFQFDKAEEQVAVQAKTGKFKLTQISETTVKGQLLAVQANGTWVNGAFTAHVCDYGDFKFD
jgi:hypothetical protein